MTEYERCKFDSIFILHYVLIKALFIRRITVAFNEIQPLKNFQKCFQLSVESNLHWVALSRSVIG